MLLILFICEIVIASTGFGIRAVSQDHDLEQSEGVADNKAGADETYSDLSACWTKFGEIDAVGDKPNDGDTKHDSEPCDVLRVHIDWIWCSTRLSIVNGLLSRCISDFIPLSVPAGVWVGVRECRVSEEANQDYKSDSEGDFPSAAHLHYFIEVVVVLHVY